MRRAPPPLSARSGGSGSARRSRRRPPRPPPTPRSSVRGSTPSSPPPHSAGTGRGGGAGSAAEGGRGLETEARARAEPPFRIHREKGRKAGPRERQEPRGRARDGRQSKGGREGEPEESVARLRLGRVLTSERETVSTSDVRRK